MPLISTTIPNLINGVSQQPETVRLSSQGEIQENGLSSVVEGLLKRPPALYMGKLADGTLTEPFVHVINRDTTERYIVIITNEHIQVFDLEGNEKTVNTPNGTGYLAAAAPQSTFRAVTVADYTFIVNTKTVVEMDPQTSTTPRPEALVWVRQGNYSTDYYVTIDGQQAAHYKTDDAAEAANADSIRTDHIAEQLKQGIAGHSGGYTVTRYGSTLRIYKNNSANFTISTSDSFGDNALKAYKGQVQRFSELPAKASEGFQIEVVGDQTSNFDNYYLKYTEAEGVKGSGVWKEVIKPGIKYSLNRGTMPWVLIREADGTFTFKPASWDTREVGDEDSNPEPSFVGRTISDILFHRNRLGVISDESVIFTRASKFFNFWRETAVDLLDSDPIDVTANHVKVSILRHAVPFNEALLLFSDQTQFVLSGGDLLTPRTVSINATTEFQASLLAKPVGSGRNVYFTVPKGEYTGLREYFVDSGARVNDALEVTANVPKYIPKDVFKIAASSNENTLALVSRADPSSIYIYRYYYSATEKLQSSWSRWGFGEGVSVLNVEFVESRLIAIVQRAYGVYIIQIPVEPGYRDDEATYTTHLDFRIDESRIVSMSYDSERDETLVELPYDCDWNRPAIQVVTRSTANQTGGIVLPSVVASINTVRVSGDIRNTPVWIGEPYTLRYRFTHPLIREDALGGGQQANSSGRLQLRTMSLVYANSGYFQVEVTPYRRQTYTYKFTGRILGSGHNIFGRVAIEDGRFRFPVQAKNDQVAIEIVSDSFLPCSFLSADWEGFYTARSRRI